MKYEGALVEQLGEDTLRAIAQESLIKSNFHGAIVTIMPSGSKNPLPACVNLTIEKPEEERNYAPIRREFWNMVAERLEAGTSLTVSIEVGNAGFASQTMRV